jgi:mannose-6-phosphate isomerase-like protein (cupin superfamily)
MKRTDGKTNELHKGFHETWFFDKDTPTNNGVMAVATFEPGVNCGLHMHDSEEFFYTLRGKGKGIIGDEEFDLEEGVAMYAPPNVPHNYTNTGDTVMEILYFMSDKSFTTTQL